MNIRVVAGTLALAVVACGFSLSLRPLWLDSRLAEAVKQRDCSQAINALNAGANPNAAPSGDYPALTRAALQGDTCTASALLQHGANVNLRDAWGGTPLFASLSQYYDLSPMGCRNGVSNGPANPNSGCWSYEMLKFLIAHNADVNASISGKTLLQLARFEHDRTHPANAQPPLPPWKDDAITLLLQSGAR